MRLRILIGCWTAILAAHVSIAHCDSLTGSRTPWTTSRIVGSPLPPPPYQTERVFPNLTFDRPVILTDVPGSSDMYLVELEGKIYRLPESEKSPPVQRDSVQRDSVQNGSVQNGSGQNDSGQRQDVQVQDKRELLFADLGELIPDCAQVYGFTFHPQFEQNRYCYICFVDQGDKPNGTVLARYVIPKTDNPTIDIASEQRILTWPCGGHNGGCIKFGPDGYLYVSAGDAGPAFPPDPLAAGQDLSNVLSTIMRIDVDRTDIDVDGNEQPYHIPVDNPFYDFPGARREIWAYGFRNPFKISFDRETGDLWVGDVGWELWEMIDHVRRSDNYGWSVMEGPQTVGAERKRGPTAITKPAAVHPHTEARSITGGHVYRGRRLPGLVGSYIYGDHVTGKIWAIRRDGENYTVPVEIAKSGLKVICFGTDSDNDLLVVGYGGTIHRFIENPHAKSANQDFPRLLSDTGLFRSEFDHEPADGVVKYQINTQPWMDGATAERLVAIPQDGRLSVYESTEIWTGKNRGSWKYPANSVLAKTISLTSPLRATNEPADTSLSEHIETRRIETQILHFDGDDWQPYTYVWNEDQTDAELADDRSTTINIEFAGETHHWNIVSRTECMICHNSLNSMILGFRPEQLDCVVETDDALGNQLTALTQLGLFGMQVDSPDRRLVDPHDASVAIDLRARSYLHVNCAHCHRPEGGGAVPMDIRFDRPLENTSTLGQRPSQGTFGIHQAQVVAAGDPYASVLMYRFSKMGRGRMPYFGSTEVDTQGLRLLHDWIAGLEQDRAAPSEDTMLAELQSTINGGESAIDAYLQSIRNCLFATSVMDGDSLSNTEKSQLIRRGATSSDVRVSDLFERFIPASQRTKRLGTSIDVAAILSASGNAERGKQLFQSDAVSCRNCHAVESPAESVGPNLASLSPKRTKAQLLESLIDPSKSIDERYIAYLVETVDGNVLTGLVQEKTEAHVVLRDKDNKTVTIPSDEIAVMAVQQRSLMPDLLLSSLTNDQATDLLAYLVSIAGAD